MFPTTNGLNWYDDVGVNTYRYICSKFECNPTTSTFGIIEKDTSGNCCTGLALAPTPAWFPNGCCPSYDYCAFGRIYRCDSDLNNKYCPDFDYCAIGLDVDYDGVSCEASCANGGDKDPATGQCCSGRKLSSNGCCIGYDYGGTICQESCESDAEKNADG